MLDVRSNETLKRAHVRMFNGYRVNLAGPAILCPDYRSFADRTTTTVQLLVGVLVLFLAADVGFVSLYRDRASSLCCRQ